MKERPILFNGEMVRAILDGRKTQTRRPVKKQKYPHGTWATPEEVAYEFRRGSGEFLPPLGTVGDRLWVKETWCWSGVVEHHQEVLWRADREYSKDERSGYSWRPSIHMPRWASRIDLEITRVWVERVQDITEEDAKAEAPDSFLNAPGLCTENPRMYLLKDGAWKAAFRDLWQSIYGTWDANPWVWVYEFRRVKP